MAKIKTKTEFAGAGCLVQGVGILVGLASFAVFPIGTLIGGLLGLGLLIHGSRMSQKLRCSDCGNPIADRAVRICPVCRASFD
ncbi:MAG TPA: hypothetical protein VLH56_10215 [Dissulfurispiraceae bacterium]|nr:hypothetical protein [Dissulfurispiraceae bacterium]